MTDPAFVAAIQAKDRILTAWESVSVRRQFHDGISNFTFVPAEKAYGPGNRDLLLQPGDPVVVTLGGQKVISGRVTTRNVSFDAESHQVVIAGASFTKDVADSSVPVRPGSYDGYSFHQIAGAILAPHGVALKVRNPPAGLFTPFKTFSIQYGESGAEVLSRMASMRGVWLSDDANGNLVAGQGNPSSAPVADLVEGQNILRAVGRLEDNTAFGKYAAVSQTVGADTTQLQRWQSATVTNPSVRDNRTKLWIAPHPDTDGLAAHVGREAAQSLWPVVQVTITVVGWFRPDGKLWEPTDNVTINSPSIFPNASGDAPRMGILSVAFAQDLQGGTTSTLECVLPQFLTSIPTAGLQDLSANEAGAPRAAQIGTPDFAGGSIFN